MFRICATYHFEAAHQLERAFSKACTDTVHGHSYKVEVFLTATCLNGDLMVMDFGATPPELKTLINEWDHALILSGVLAREYQRTPSKKIVILPANPTAEVMAKVIYDSIASKFPKEQNGLALEKVRVYETAGHWAEYQP